MHVRHCTVVEYIHNGKARPWFVKMVSQRRSWMLVENVVQVLEQAVEVGGSSLNDFADVNEHSVTSDIISKPMIERTNPA